MDNSKREKDIYTRIDARRTPGTLGRGADLDGARDGEKENSRDYGHREDAFRQSETHGFWKRSEFLACNRGDTMHTLDLSTFMGGPTWQRAREAFNTDHPKTCAE